MQRIIINKKEFLPGQSGEHILNTYYLPSRTPIDGPVFVMRSMNPGPVVLFQAGVCLLKAKFAEEAKQEERR
jgi:hypothetical protein